MTMSNFKTSTNEYITERKIDYIKSIIKLEERRDEEGKELGYTHRVQINTPIGRYSNYVCSFEEAQNVMAQAICILCKYECVSAVAHLIRITENVFCFDNVFYNQSRCFSELHSFEVVIIDLNPKTRGGKDAQEIELQTAEDQIGETTQES